MKFSKIIKNLRTEYKCKEENKATIELMYINKSLKKGSVGSGTN